MSAIALTDITDITEAHRLRSRADPELAPLWRLLDDVVDPEIPVLSLWDLGVLRDLNIDGDTVDVVLTPTYVGCPALLVMEQDIRAALERAGYQARVVNVLSPPWSSAWISERGRQRLREYGIAPPRERAGMAPHCPRCRSGRVERISEFGSTACKALWRCTDCAEPFDYFKCI